MAKTISEEELQLRKRARRRLIGAIALVTMVAVFLPMILDHEPKSVNQDISIRIPAPNSVGTFTSKIVPVVPAAPETVPAPGSAPTVAASPPPPVIPPPSVKSGLVARDAPVYDSEAAPPRKAAVDNASVEKPKPQVPVPKAVAKLPAKTAAAPKPAVKPQSGVHSTGGYVVQVAALNDADKARAMQEKITSAGAKAYTEVVPTKKGSVTRVRAGPFATREDAEKMRNKLKELGLTGNIVPK